MAAIRHLLYGSRISRPLTVLLLTCTLVSSGPAAGAVSTLVATDCAVGDRAMAYSLPPAGFERYQDHTVSTPPFPPNAPGVSPPAYSTGFVKSRVLGDFLVAAVNDAQASSASIPPFKGPIVARYPAVLELYQTNWVFNGSDAAIAWLKSMKASAELAASAEVNGRVEGVDPSPVAIGDEAFVAASSSSTPPSTERYQLFVASWRNVVIVLRLQGGDEIPANAVSVGGRTALQTLQKECA